MPDIVAKPPLHARGVTRGCTAPSLLKIATVLDYAREGIPVEQCALWLADPDLKHMPELAKLPWGAGFGGQSCPDDWPHTWVGRLHRDDVVAPGDVIALRPDGQISVRYRRGADSNTLFLTERCNSRCRMCSQPPVDVEEPHLEEVLALIDLIDRDEPVLGITGGEPTLPNVGLEKVLAACKDKLSSTALHILSNGRPLSDRCWTATLAGIGHQSVLWSVPVFSDTGIRHDKVAGVGGAFNETLNGLYNLAESNQSVEVRVILQKPTLPRLRQTAYFIFRNLPFVRHVAFMGLEPMGYARGRWDELWTDPVDYRDDLVDAIYYLVNRGIATSVYNLPICILPESLHQFAQQSISDWKNMFLPKCDDCALKTQCAGFFVSSGQRWVSRGVKPVIC